MNRLPTVLALATLLAAPAALAQGEPPAAAPQRARISVVGQGSVSLPPDFATVSVGIETRGASAAEALDANSASARRLLEAARASGVAEADLGTSAVSLQPELRASRVSSANDAGTVSGYRAVNTVTVQVRALDGLGAFLRRAVEGGANRIDGIGFGLAEPERARDEAQAAAVRDARRQAETFATAAGVRLGDLERMTTAASADMPLPPVPMRQAKASRPIPVAAGAVRVDAQVMVTWLTGN